MSCISVLVLGIRRNERQKAPVAIWSLLGSPRHEDRRAPLVDITTTKLLGSSATTRGKPTIVLFGVKAAQFKPDKLPPVEQGS